MYMYMEYGPTPQSVLHVLDLKCASDLAGPLAWFVHLDLFLNSAGGLDKLEGSIFPKRRQQLQQLLPSRTYDSVFRMTI